MTKYERARRLEVCRQIITEAKKITDAGRGSIKIVPEKETVEGHKLYTYLKKEGEI